MECQMDSCVWIEFYTFWHLYILQFVTQHFFKFSAIQELNGSTPLNAGLYQFLYPSTITSLRTLFILFISTNACTLTVCVPSLDKGEGDANGLCYLAVSLNSN